MNLDSLSYLPANALKILADWAKSVYTTEVERMLSAEGEALIKAQGRATLARELWITLSILYEERRNGYERAGEVE